MNMHFVRIFILLTALLGARAGTLPGEPQAKKQGVRSSPPYTVLVSLQARSPFVADGRMSIADLAFSATFKDVVFYYERGKGPGVSEKYDGKLFLTQHEFNDVDDSGDRHRPWVKKEWPVEFPASLVGGWVEREEEPETDPEVDDIPLVPLVPGTIKLGFHARFGLLDLEWFSKLGSCVLSNMLFEFEVPWPPLLDGKPHTLKLPYEGDYPEDTGTWWIEFIPKKR
jgi:hypothetical protein